MISVIIPAHNEANVIDATLSELLPGVETGEFEVIVVCNGCIDNTVSKVQAFGGNIKCLETSVASKTNALNLGDEAAGFYPRIYLDADVRLSTDCAIEIAKVLLQGPYLAASPTLWMDYSNTGWVVRSYYEIWQQLPYVQEGMIGTGVFALSEEGRNKFEQFPDIIADDGFVRAMFTSDERVCVDQCNSLVRSPANLASLIKIKKRSRLGRYELAEKFPGLLGNEEKKYGSALKKVIWQPRNWLNLTVYLYVNFMSRILAKKHQRGSGYIGWERDESSRMGK